MKPALKQLLVILAILVFVYVMIMPIVMGGFSYGAERASRSALQGSLHNNHSGLMSVLETGSGWMGSNALSSGLLQLGLLAVIVLGSVWLVAGLLARQSQKSS